MRAIALMFLFGLTLKLLLLPFAMHSDLLSMYFRAHLMSEYQLWGLPTNQFLAHLIYAFNLKVMSLVGFDIQGLFQLPFGLREGSLTSSVGDWLRFAENPAVNAALFWFKLPHLLVDIGVFAILWRYFDAHKYKALILTTWWLNPINIYAFYVFSRHDVFTLFALLLAVIFSARRQILASALSLFAAIQIRVQPLMLAPVFLVSWWKHKKSLRQLLQAAAVFVLFSVIYMFIVKNLPFDTETYQKLVGTLHSGNTGGSGPSAIGIPARHASQVFGTSFLGIPVFLVLYGAIGTWYFLVAKKQLTEEKIIKQLVTILLVVMAAYFAINPFSPHYFVWLSLFFTLAVSFQPKVIAWYALGTIGWALMGIFSADVTWFSQNLLVPISTDIFRTPQIQLILQTKIGHLVFTAGMLFGVGRLILVIAMTGMSLTVLETRKLGRLIKTLTPALILGASLTYSASGVSAAPVPTIENADYNIIVPIEDSPLGQNFTSNSNTFGSIEVRLGTDRIEGRELFLFRLKEADSDEWLYENYYQREDLYSGYYYPFGFPEVTSSDGKEYYFEISRPNYSGQPLHGFRNSETGDISFIVVRDGSTSELIDKIGDDLREKYQAQKTFFTLYFILLALPPLGLLALLLAPKSK